MDTILSILIPTYNRKNFLEKNLELLFSIIIKNKFEKEIELIISDNCSTDGTKKYLEKLDNPRLLNITIYRQKSILPINKNLIFVVKKANSPFFMWLGDDDYINNEYLVEVIKKIKEKKNLKAIIPSFINIDIHGNIIKGGRDLTKSTKLYNSGFQNCLLNSYKGHQMSGLVFQKEDSLTIFNTAKLKNLYPSIFFAAHCCLKGKCLLLTDYPIKVTIVPQSKKNWTYGNDGLVSDILENYKKLPGTNYIQRVLLELRFLIVQKWRYQNYLYIGIKAFFSALKTICLSKNITLISASILPLLALYFSINQLFVRSINKIKKMVLIFSL